VVNTCNDEIDVLKIRNIKIRRIAFAALCPVATVSGVVFAFQIFSLSAQPPKQSPYAVSDATVAPAEPDNYFTGNSNVQEQAGDSAKNTPVSHAGSAATAPALPWFFNAMNPAVNTNAVKILITGDSSMNSAQSAVASGIWAGAKQYMAWGGGLGDTLGPGLTYSSGVKLTMAPDTNWYYQYATMPAGESATNGSWLIEPTTNADTITVAYIAGPNEGVFAVYQLPVYGGPGVLVATINAWATDYGGAVSNIALAAPTNVLASAICITGTVRILTLGALANQRHCLQIIGFGFGAQTPLRWTNTQTNIFVPVMRGLNPALLIFQDRNDTTANLAAGYSNFIAFWSNALPEADQIHLGTYAASNTIDPGGTNALAQNVEVKYWAGQANRFYIDLFHLLPDTDTMTALHWYIDGEHFKPTTVREGGMIWNAMLWQLQGINLFDTNYFQGTYFQGPSQSSGPKELTR